MADALPLTDGRVSPGRASVAVASSGAFGDRVAECLSTTLPHVRTTSADVSNAFAVARDAVVLALWRPEPALCEQADEAAHRFRIPWLAVIMEHPVIRVGPLVNPGLSPCFRCYQRRRQQHDTQPAATSALLAAYAADSGLGPTGYLPHQGRLAAGVARRLLDEILPGPAIKDGRSTPGQVTTIRLLGGGMNSSSVIACHGCLRCGQVQGPAGHLAEALAGVWSMPDLASRPRLLPMTPEAVR